MRGTRDIQKARQGDTAGQLPRSLGVAETSEGSRGPA